jgi:hypothetical protein
LIDRAVGLVEHDDLVARLQRDRAQHRVDAGARVVDEDEVVAARADELADRVGRLAQQRARRAGASSGVIAHQLAEQEAAGCASMRRCQACCASSTTRGVAPTVPWFR